jgi:hypothetical protein
MEIDLHGYHPTDIIETGTLTRIVQQSWEMGEKEIYFIHGHGRNRANPRSFANTNTGYFGLAVRSHLRHTSDIRQWIKHTTLNCQDPGITSVKLKRNPNPSRTAMDSGILKPLTERTFRISFRRDF